jgi:glycylpeptide N-tetradecanoyltransferase
MSGKETKPDDKLELNTVEEQEEFLRVLNQLRLAQAPPAPEQPRLQDDYKFWKTQPVPKIDEFPSDHGAIDAPKTVADVRAEPYAMPAGFTWCDVDFTDDAQAQEVYDLLVQNYVEDDGATLRFDYSVDFLKWALTPPGFHKQWHVGVRNTKTNKLMAFISGIPVTTRVYEHEMAMAEINFLCVHKKLRTKRLAPVLIKEITRRVNLLDIWQAIYTAGAVLPMPVSQCRYFHRSLNPKKLVEIGFSPLPPRMTMSSLIKALRMPTATAIPGFRPMERKDLVQVEKLLKEYQAKCQLITHYNEDEVAHWMLPQDGVVSSFVVENPETHEVTDFSSFYHLPSSVLGNDKHKTLRAAYSFYNVATSVSLTALMQDTLVVAKQLDFDVFNALTIMQNDQFLEPLKFAKGSGQLQYYLYNWRCPRMPPKDVGVVLC